jgi:NADH-ubiquinone oxidoreductase chain 4
MIFDQLYLYLYKLITFFTISIINPLTLLIIPLIGSLIILAYPFSLTSAQDFRSKKGIIGPVPVSNLAIKETSSYLKQGEVGAISTVHLLTEEVSGGSEINIMQSSARDKLVYTNNAINSLIVKSNLVKENSNLKKIAIITSLMNFFISIILWIKFDSNYMGYQFITSISNLEFVHLNLGVDGLSLFFVLLTTFITPIALLASHNEIEKNLRFYLVSILLLETLQIAVFVVLDLLLFYIFFESVLIPLFFIVGVWGASAAKVRAAFLLFLYTLFGSLFMLLAIIKVYSYLGATDFGLISVSEINLEYQKILWLAFFLAFAIKTPLWPFTGWLFRAHVEAPLSGSVILAAVILKLASYAYLRIMISFLPDATHFYSPLLQGVCVITLIYASLSALRSHDSKALVALSSISHCALIVLGLFSNTIIGIEGGILVSLAHGYISPALFIIVGGIIYTRVHSRVIQYIRGLTLYMPILSIFFIIFALANASIPLTLGWVGEQMTLIGLFERSPIIGALGATSIFLTACYSVFLYNRLMFGNYSAHLKPLLDLDRREFIILFSLLLPTLLFGIFPNLILDSLHPSVSELIYNIPTSRN